MAQAAEQHQKQQEAQNKRDMMIAAVCTAEARERCTDFKLFIAFTRHSRMNNLIEFRSNNFCL